MVGPRVECKRGHVRARLPVVTVLVDYCLDDLVVISVPSLSAAVALRVVHGGADVPAAPTLDELFEHRVDEFGAVVGHDCLGGFSEDEEITMECLCHRAFTFVWQCDAVVETGGPAKDVEYPFVPVAGRQFSDQVNADYLHRDVVEVADRVARMLLDGRAFAFAGLAVQYVLANVLDHCFPVHSHYADSEGCCFTRMAERGCIVQCLKYLCSQ